MEEVSNDTSSDAITIEQAAKAMGVTVISVKRAKKIKFADRHPHARAGEFVLWWDTSGERGKGNQYVLSNRTVREQLNDFGLSEMTVSRWRTRLTKNAEPSIRDAVEAARARPLAEHGNRPGEENSRNSVRNTNSVTQDD